MCNSSVATIFHAIIIIIGSIYGFREDTAINAPSCALRAYFYLVSLTAICYSKAIQAMSHLFFSVLYKHRFLLTWRMHRILIIINWIIAFIVCVPLIFIDANDSFEIESRSCILSTKIYVFAFCMANISCLFPYGIIAIVVVIIIIHIRRSTRRVQAIRENSPNTTQKRRREIKLIKQMSAQTATVTLAAPLYLFLIIWHVTQKRTGPEPLYLLSLNSITISLFMLTALQFIMNQEVNQLIKQFFKRCCTFIIMKKSTDQQ
ncbi:unnamed protein product [Adineta steineri]|uniref:G-protein coupled receptors family 1 profile domain-containing protein n=1 Tax=Adineta steineri TaxID=433720 RepID=A0A813ZM67_9BILA|nr:unnamed protein product [Adineta steineri]CAF4082560.1 unnamed protein product [Adineta steineri]